MANKEQKKDWTVGEPTDYEGGAGCYGILHYGSTVAVVEWDNTEQKSQSWALERADTIVESLNESDRAGLPSPAENIVDKDIILTTPKVKTTEGLWCPIENIRSLVKYAQRGWAEVHDKYCDPDAHCLFCENYSKALSPFEKGKK